MIHFNVKDPVIRKKISESLKGNQNGIGNKANSGRKLSEETRKKISHSMRNLDNKSIQRGETHWNWRGGVRKEKRRHGVRRLKLRFEVLKRDNFSCRYCGRNSSIVSLEIDHIVPKSKGGENSIGNYVTACEDCNLGKGDRILNEFKEMLEP